MAQGDRVDDQAAKHVPLLPTPPLSPLAALLGEHSNRAVTGNLRVAGDEWSM